MDRENGNVGIALLPILISALLITTVFSGFAHANGGHAPHSLVGHAQYSGGSWAQGTIVHAHNDDTNDWIYDADTVGSTGVWTFNVGAPGPSWSDGDQVTIYIKQGGTAYYQGWTGNTTITIDTSSSPQDCGTITLNPSSSPNPPSAPSGPSIGDHNTQYSYSTSTTDPESGDIYYWFDWGNGHHSGWVGPYSSGGIGSADYTWSLPGTYDIKVKAKGTGDAESGWSSHTTVTMGNTAPPAPNAPSGETSGHHATSYSYSTNTVTDPEGDNVLYKFDWNDGSDSGWIGATSTSHSWSEKGDYEIRVKAKDIYNMESDWSDPLSISMPKDKAINPPFLQFLDNHPHLFPLLRHLMGL